MFEYGRCNECEWKRTLRHELNNILAPLLGQVQALLAQELSLEMRERLARMETMLKSISGLLGVTKPAVFEAIQLGRVMELALERYGAELGEEFVPVEFRWQGCGPSDRVIADKEALSVCLLNLLRNASEFPLADRKVIVEISAVGRKAVIAVLDGGPGLPPGLLEGGAGHFTTKGPGHGYGLRIVKDICLRLGCTLESRRGPAGHRMVLQLPLLDARRTRPQREVDVDIGCVSTECA